MKKIQQSKSFMKATHMASKFYKAFQYVPFNISTEIYQESLFH